MGNLRGGEHSLSRQLPRPPSTNRVKQRGYFFIYQRESMEENSEWNIINLSGAEKEILLKTVVQAIPSYAMSVFLLPLSLCEELERMMNSYRWGRDREKRRRVCWTTWDKLCKH